MSDRPLVSVVIPARDAEAWIAETLGSVFAQSYGRERLDVVVVDDGSRDATAVVAEQHLGWSGWRYQILRHETPRGPSAARNRGWRAAAGRWIQFLDADDLLAADKIARQCEIAGDKGDATLAAIHSPWGYLVQGTGGHWEPSSMVNPSLASDPLRELLVGGNFVATGSLLFSRSWLERVGGYNESYRLVEDLDLLMRIVIAGGRLEALPADAPTFWYRQHATSLSREDTGNFVRACLRNLEAAESHWRATDALTPVRATVLADEYFRLARFFAEHDAAQFDELIGRIYALRPQFVPPRPASLRRASRIVGYRRAERMAVHYRRLKRFLQSSQAAR